jgi:hypothetical protein
VSRDDGFQTADIDVGFLRDVKVRRLRQHVPADDLPATVLLYLAVVLSSWEEGYRLTADEADSPIDPTPERIAALTATGLLDGDGKVPLRAWEAWFRPAWDRRDKKRVGGVEGNRRRWHPDRPTQSDTESDSESDSVSPSIRPSVYPSVSPSRASSNDATKKTGHEDVLTGRVPCPEYVTHQSMHYFADGQWRCRACEVPA